MSVHDRRSPGELGDPDLAGAAAGLLRAAERVRRAAGGGVQGRRDRLGETGPGAPAIRAKHERRRDVKPSEDDFGSREHDAPDRRMTDCERVPEPLPEQIAHTWTVRGSLPQAPKFSLKGSDSQCRYPSHEPVSKLDFTASA